MVEQKYKQTEIGNVPKGWSVISLGEICVPSKTRIDPRTAGRSFRCIELEHLSQGSGQLLGYADSSELLSQKTAFAKNDVLFGKLRPYLRKFLYAPFDGVCTTEIWALQVSTNAVDKFAFYLVQSDRVVEAANQSTGTKMPRAEWKTVSQTLVALPTKEEQTAIATALSDTDALIAGLEKLIAKKRNIKQGAMQELLRPKEGWVEKSFVDIIMKRDGIKIGPFGSQLKKELLVDGGYKVYGQENVYDRDMNLGNRFITKDHFQKLKSCELIPGDFIISMMGTIGKCMIVPDNIERGIMDSHLIRLRLDKSIVAAAFLYHFFSSATLKRQVSNLSVGGIMDGLSSKVIKLLTVPLPKTIKEQQTIIHVLSDMDAEIEALERKWAKYKEIKQGMMQVLLTGKVRLV